MIIPVGHRLLVKSDDLELQTEWGFHIVQDEKREKHGQVFGTVVSLGPDCWKAFRKVQEGKEVNGSPWASVGDKVVYAQYAGKFLTDPDNGEEYIIILDEDVVAIIRETEKEDG